MSSSTNLAPAVANAATTALPRTPAAPVITQTLSFRFIAALTIRGEFCGYECRIPVNNILLGLDGFKKQIAGRLTAPRSPSWLEPDGLGSLVIEGAAGLTAGDVRL
jgi:hypothetical protein